MLLNYRFIICYRLNLLKKSFKKKSTETNLITKMSSVEKVLNSDEKRKRAVSTINSIFNNKFLSDVDENKLFFFKTIIKIIKIVFNVAIFYVHFKFTRLIIFISFF